MQTDVKAASLSSTGSVYADRTRLRGFTISYASGGTVVITDGGASGATVFSFTAPAAAGSINVLLPGEGIRCTTSVYVTLSSATATVVYG